MRSSSRKPGAPVEIVYPTEGTPLIIGPNGIFKSAPNPNAARLFQSFSFTPECQQLIIDLGGLRSMHPATREKPGRKPFRDIKTMKDDPAAVETHERGDQGALHQDFRGVGFRCHCEEPKATKQSRWTDTCGSRLLRFARNDGGRFQCQHRRSPDATSSRPRPRAGAALFAAPLRAQAPAASAITPALIAAAQKEGKVAFYTAMDLPVAEKLAKAFEAKYSGIAVRVERSGAERVFQRIGQEMDSNIHAGDVVNSADAAHFIVWKRNGWLAPYLPEEVAQALSRPHYRDPDGLFVTTRVWLSSLGYNTNLVKAEDAPKSFADLLDPKWSGKMVKAHPAYSGTIMTATFQIVRELGWGYLEKLANQRIMQVQSSTDPPKKLALGERAVMADGNDYNLIQLKDAGQPVEPIYPTEGTPTITGPTGVFKSAPNPNAARLFQNWLHSRDGQQLLVDFTGQHSVHAQVTDKPGRKKLSEIKLMKDDPAGVEKMADEIKARYQQAVQGVMKPVCFPRVMPRRKRGIQ